jgi:hypothetical protein
MIWEIINGIGTLSFAVIALLAIFYPEIKFYYKKAKFAYVIVEYGPTNNRSVFLKVINVGKGPAYGLRCLLQIKYNGDVILSGKQSPSRRLIKDNKPGEIYDGFDLYPTEESGFQLIHLGSRRAGQPQNLLEITSYPWTWESDAFAELNSYDRKELKTTSERVYRIIITLVDRNNVYSSFESEFVYDGNNLKVSGINYGK